MSAKSCVLNKHHAKGIKVMIGGKNINQISEDNLVNWQKYMETIYLDYDTPSCPIMVFGSDEIFSIWLILQLK